MISERPKWESIALDRPIVHPVKGVLDRCLVSAATGVEIDPVSASKPFSLPAKVIPHYRNQVLT